MSQFRTVVVRLSHDPLGWNGRLLVPLEEAELIGKRADGSRRVLCSVEGIAPWQAALTHDGQGGYYIIVSKERLRSMERAGLDLNQLLVGLEADESTYGAPMPEELQVLLESDPEGDQYFHALTPGKQRNLIYMLGRFKSEQTRLRKAVAVVDYLKLVRGKLDFRGLLDYMREQG